MKILKPMLAGSFSPSKANFPYFASPKIDGIRFLMVDGQALSRSFKPIRNEYIQSLLQANFPDGIDGELTCGDTFQTSTSAIMRIKGEPDFKVWVFDYVDPASPVIFPYCARRFGIPTPTNPPFKLEVLKGQLIHTMDELDAYEAKCLEQGYEGVMLRDPMGTYKFGRSSTNEGILLKVKRFSDGEARITGFVEKKTNQNAPQKDALGHTMRTSHLAGMVPANTLGAVVVETEDGMSFQIGSGFNDELRKEVWENQSAYLSRLVKYKSFDIGVKEKPRHPIFLGFRDPDDL